MYTKECDCSMRNFLPTPPRHKTGTAAGIGGSDTLSLRDEECGATYYEIRLDATDSDGNTASDIIQVAVQAWDC